MYTLTISSYSSSQTFEFNNLRQALNSFIERCDELGLEYTEDNDGNFTAGGFGHSHEITLTSNF
jgi:hypothetical protein